MTEEAHHDAAAPSGALMALLDESFTAHHAAAVALARRILGDAHLAEDAVQLAFLQILVRVRTGDAALLTANPRAMVLRGTRWAALKLAERDRDRHAAASLDEAGPESTIDPWDHAEARLVSSDIVATLPVHYRDALMLRYVEDQPDDSAAARLALTVKAYRRRLDRALVAARSSATRLGSGTAGALVALVRPRTRLLVRARYMRLDSRLRQARARLGSMACGPGFSHIAMVVAIAGISAAVLAPLGGSPPGVAAPPQTGVAAVLGGAPGAAPQDASTSGRPGSLSDVTAAPVPPRPPIHPTPQASNLLPVLAAPPPSQANVDSVLPADRYESNHVIVLGATLPSCGCAALYRSADGGATWQGRVLSQSVGLFALPPHYPDDPRIVHWHPDQPACLLADFAATACTPTPLFGRVAFDANFDNGNPVIYGQATMNHGFLAYNVQTGVVQPLLLGGQLTSIDVVTPPVDTRSGAYLVAQASPSSGLSVGGYGPPELFWCSRQLVCQQEPRAWEWDFAYRVDRMDTTGLMLGAQGWSRSAAFAASYDGGASQAFRISTTQPASNEDYELIGPPGDVTVLQTDPSSSASTSVVRWRPDCSSEQLSPLPPFSTSDSNAFVVVPVTPQRFLAYVYGTLGSPLIGYWCTVDGGHSWQRSCSPEQ